MEDAGKRLGAEGRPCGVADGGRLPGGGRGHIRQAGRLALHVLASGSRGNAAIVEDSATGEGIVIDCGICKRDFFARAEEAGFDLARIAGILITHEHADHTKGLGVVLRGLAKRGAPPAVYVADAVRAASAEVQALRDSFDLRALSLGEGLSLGGMRVHPFRTSHDAASSCGFRFESSDGDAVGFMTDTGVVTDEAREALRDVRLLGIESNHDARMLWEGPYPYPVRRRVAGDEGHLSNDQAAEALEGLLGDRLEQVVALHVSQSNNTYRLPVETLSAVLARQGHPARVQAGFQTMLESIR